MITLSSDVNTPDHQEPHVRDEISSKLIIGDVISRNIQPEVLRRKAASIGEVNDEVELYATIHSDVTPDAADLRSGFGMNKLLDGIFDGCHNEMLN
jgi:hypothetical protein